MVATRSFSAAQVRTVAPGMILTNPIAVQYRVLVLLAAIEGRRITPAGTFGAGWRDLATQRLFYAASRGDVAAITTLRLRGTVLASNRTKVAAPGTSSHGDSTRIDVLVNGHDVTDADAAWIERVTDWDREFGADDRNHFAWRGSMSGAVSEHDRNRIVGHWLNGQHLGRTTTTERTGGWEARSNFSWLLQTRGHEDGLYPTSRYQLDGVRGPRTVWLRDRYAARLLA